MNSGPCSLSQLSAFFTYISNILYVHRIRTLFSMDTFKRCLSSGSTETSREGEATRCEHTTLSTLTFHEQNRVSEIITQPVGSTCSSVRFPTLKMLVANTKSLSPSSNQEVRYQWFLTML